MLHPVPGFTESYGAPHGDFRPENKPWNVLLCLVGYRAPAAGAAGGIDPHLVGFPADAEACSRVPGVRWGAPDGDREAADRLVLSQRQNGAATRKGTYLSTACRLCCHA